MVGEEAGEIGGGRWALVGGQRGGSVCVWMYVCVCVEGVGACEVEDKEWSEKGKPRGAD